jgi:hypothetical protein
MVVARFLGLEMNVGIKDCVRPFKQYEKRPPFLYDYLLQRLIISHQWQRVGMNILYRARMEEGSYQLNAM